MNILVDLTHPAHIHFFRNMIIKLQEEGHKVKLTGRNKDILVELANSFKMDMEVFGTARKGSVNLGLEMLYRWCKILRIIKTFKPDVMMAIAGTFISVPGKLSRIPTYVFSDTEHANISNLLSFPFATCVYVPQCYRKSIRWRHKRYNGYHELAYLHPNYFTPDNKILREVGIKPGEIFSIVRFVGWGAAHDIGLEGFSTDKKILAIKELARFGKVFITAEGHLPDEIEQYRLNINVAQIHNLMAYAALIFGESATMASEAAVLGVPSIFLDTVGRGYTDEEEEFGLVFNFTPENQEESIEKAKEILREFNKDEWKRKAKILLSSKIDVTQTLCRIATQQL